MGSSEHSRTTGVGDGGTTVFTDGACSGNPGPGGWAWVQPGGEWASGFEADTTNQRMELTAVLRACERFGDPLRIVSDSTYVVNCWRDRWWQGWLKRNWRNSRKEPVANRDLWEAVVPHFRDRAGLHLEWVKGHSGDRWNDLADRLAVGAVQRRDGSAGRGDPPVEVLGAEDRVGRASGAGPPGAHSPAAVPPDASGTGVPAAGGWRSEQRRATDPRVPVGYLLAVTGLREGSGVFDDAVVARLSGVLAAHKELHVELLVLTGLRRGAETAAAEAATRADVPFAVVLPYPDPTTGWPQEEAAAFRRHLERARDVLTLEKVWPSDLEGRRKSLARRDGWLRSAVDAAVLVTDGTDEEAERSLKRWEKALGEELWRFDVAPT